MKIALKRTVAPSGSSSSGIRGWNAQRILKYDKLSFFIKLLCVGLCITEQLALTPGPSEARTMCKTLCSSL